MERIAAALFKSGLYDKVCETRGRFILNFYFVLLIIELILTYNPGQNIGDTFPNMVICLAHCYYIKQTSPIPPPINVVLLFSFLTDSTLFWGRGGKLRGLF